MGLDEDILVVPRADLFWRGPFHGVSTDELDEYLTRIRRFGIFRRRGAVEDDPSLKQIIPYLVVRSGGRYMLFQRTQAVREGRLRGLFSIGVGGHIARDDVRNGGDVVTEGLRREMVEELDLRGPWSARLVGVLNDDGNPVGQVHFGLVHLVDVASGSVTIRETDLLTGRLAPFDEVRATYSQMETWSQLVLDAEIVGP
jgi:predicted NUDIX family phosphoesterase